MQKYKYIFLIILILFPNIHASEYKLKKDKVGWKQFFGLYRAKALYSYDRQNDELSVVLDDMSWHYEHHCPEYKLYIDKNNEYIPLDRIVTKLDRVKYNSIYLDYGKYFRYVTDKEENWWGDEINGVFPKGYANFIKEYEVWQKFTNHPEYINIFYNNDVESDFLIFPFDDDYRYNITGEGKGDVHSYITYLGNNLWGKKLDYLREMFPYRDKFNKPYIIPFSDMVSITYILLEKISGPEICLSYDTAKEYFKSNRPKDEITRYLLNPRENPKPKNFKLPKYKPQYPKYNSLPELNIETLESKKNVKNKKGN